MSNKPINKPQDSFAIWHINGMSKYVHSVWLSLSHYMGSVYQARKMLYLNKPALFARNKNGDLWTGQNTWLEAFFKNDLLIFGIGLYKEEVFLRWLLIERQILQNVQD